MRAPAWLRIGRPRTSTTGTGTGTVTVTMTADTTRFVDAMTRASLGARELASVLAYRNAIEHQRALGRAYVGIQLDDMAYSLGLDPVQAWRLPRARDARVAALSDPDRGRRRAAEAAWLAAHRAHQAEQAEREGAP